MATPAATLDLLLMEVRALRREVAELRRARVRLLSQREAAKHLGVGREQIAVMVRSGALRLVMGKVPADDLDRIVQEGVPEPRQKARRVAPVAANEAQAIRALKV